jgi:hypothetical protein
MIQNVKFETHTKHLCVRLVVTNTTDIAKIVENTNPMMKSHIQVLFNAVMLVLERLQDTHEWVILSGKRRVNHMNRRQKKKKSRRAAERATEAFQKEYDWCKLHRCKFYGNDKRRADYRTCGLHFGFCHGNFLNGKGQ